MKNIAMLLMLAGLLFSSSPAFAEGAKLNRLVEETQKDYDTLKTNFRAAYNQGSPSWDAYRKSSGFDVIAVETRIAARRQALARIDKAGRTLPAAKRGVVLMLARDLGNINVSMLALIRGDKGYAGYIRTRDDELVKGISDWQEGIRSALIETRRCVEMTRAVSGTLDGGAMLIPLKVHK